MVTYDVVIVGGGMVGATLANALGGSSLRVLVLESAQPPSVVAQAPWEIRVSAINRASETIFRTLGTWEGMEIRRVSPIRTMNVWDKGGRVIFQSADLGEPHLGHIVENAVVQAALVEQLTRFANVERWCPARLAHWQDEGQGYRLELVDGRTLHTRLVVGADGADSRVKELAGIPSRVYDFQQQGVVGVVRTQKANPETAWQCFLPTGPLAFLPLRDGQSSIVWTVPHSQGDRLVSLQEKVFLEELQAAFGDSLGTLLGGGPRASFVLKSRHAERYIASRSVLVGDAAHTIHPLAGQGVNLGLLDAATLAEVLLEDPFSDPGSTRVLRRYERARKGSNWLMALGMEGFHHLFTSTLPLIPELRQLGLSVVNNLNPVKNGFMYHAMGLPSPFGLAPSQPTHLPRLALGQPLVADYFRARRRTQAK